ncbi:hypothetical protein [Lagierella sp.]|uniref:hypothetical protein n=1 Tax=Lagierella sp. TaxID=2849657 RepID=UPI002624ADA4|nr:hypothetical protein [Lagierella sp.]
MHLAKKKEDKLKEDLKSRFLYQDDLDSLYLLLSVIESEYRCNTLRPKYSCTKRVFNAIGKFFNGREDIDEIKSAGVKVLNEDLSRLEFAIYLEAYSLGYENFHAVNYAENFVLSKLSPKDLKGRKKLFHTYKDKETREVKKYIVKGIKSYKEFEKNTEILVRKYFDRVIRDKIYYLNKYLDKQLIFRFDGVNTYIVEERFITLKELEQLFDKLLKTYIRSIKFLSKEAVWFGVNDRVLSRY